MADKVAIDNSSELTGPPSTRSGAGAGGVRGGGAGPFRVYKPRQGTTVRWCTAAGGGIIAVGFAAFLREYMQLLPYGDSLWVGTLVPAALLVVLAYVIFWLVGKNRTTVDFMIQTEGEMKKVNWSSRKEIIGATKVVIFVTLMLGLMLFIVDLIFMFLFSAIGVLKIPIWEAWLGPAVG